MISSLPKPVRHRIYALALPGSRVDVEVTDDGSLLTKQCSLLRISSQVRKDVLDACSEDHLKLDHTFRSPTPLILANVNGLSKHFKAIRVRLLTLIEDENMALDPEPWRRLELQAINNLSIGWRIAFRVLPPDIPLKMVYFDLSSSFEEQTYVGQPAKLLNMLSAVVQRRSQRRARCKVLGWKNEDGLDTLEDHTVGVIRHRPDWKPAKLAWRTKEEVETRSDLVEQRASSGTVQPQWHNGGVRSPVLERSRL